MNVERSHHVEVDATVDEGGSYILLECRVCDWFVWTTVHKEAPTTLADLIDLADEHFDATGGHP